ncbi:hypothetical protein [Aquabacterium sp. CECT 9606]|uniref:hypothetical protein n=1 Tax=Aquabacterium sp. CECT 9606 TaxID=2845822 RepID=UPI001E4FDAB6|nr:hypothetical protein [Aquabacterium sp. CECT 9606]CAH0351044.1 hypothetical protein AQB9606_01896 [Aquabacterium sp. CECT 9606]
MFDFLKLSLNDAEIESVTAKREQLIVNYKNWKEESCTLVFSEVAGYQWFSPEGKSLSHGTIETDDPLLAHACEAAEEDSLIGFKIYSFVSAWSNSKILRIVAKDVSQA